MCLKGIIQEGGRASLTEVKRRGRLEKQKANACPRKRKTKVWTSGLPFICLLVTLVKQCHLGMKTGLSQVKAWVSQQYRSHRMNPQFASNVGNTRSAYIHVSVFFSFYSAFLEIPIWFPFSFTYTEHSSSTTMEGIFKSWYQLNVSQAHDEVLSGEHIVISMYFITLLVHVIKYVLTSNYYYVDVSNPLT